MSNPEKTNQEETAIEIAGENLPAVEQSEKTIQERIVENRELIKALAPQIKKHHLLDTGKDEKYMKVGGGEAIAQTLGFTVSVDDTEYFPTGDEVPFYRAKAWLLRDGVKVAWAHGYLGMDEPRWAVQQLYAKKSMCQTRAVAKLCRVNFGALYILLGATSDTPAEEMTFAEQGAPATPAPQQATKKHTPVAGNNGVGTYTVTDVSDKMKRDGTPLVGKSGAPCVAISTGEGMTFDTFAPWLAEAAKKALKDGNSIEVSYTTNDYGHNVQDLKVLEEVAVGAVDLEEVDHPFGDA